MEGVVDGGRGVGRSCLSSVLCPLSAGFFLRSLELYFLKKSLEKNNRLWWLGGETWTKSRGNCGRGKGGRGKGGVGGIASLTRPTFFGDGNKDRGRGNRSLGRRWRGGRGRKVRMRDGGSCRRGRWCRQELSLSFVLCPLSFVLCPLSFVLCQHIIF